MSTASFTFVRGTLLYFTLPLLMLTAIGIRKWPNWVVTLLVLVSIAHYVLGSLFLCRVLA